LRVRISELARQTGVPVATIKYYLREGLLHPGEATAATQADYDESHARRLTLIRALLQVGRLSVASIREVLGALDHSGSMHDALGAVHGALPPHADDVEPVRARALAKDLGWRVHPDGPAGRQLEHALQTLDAVGYPVSDERLQVYAQAARDVAECDVASVPATSPEEAATTVIVGTVLYEPVLLALRRMAHEAVSAERFGRPR
jgi:DNA-binding transcriptional MerR regulator